MGVLIGATLGTLASIPWIIACKAKLRGHALMLEQMACFDCRAAQCTIEADRVLVEQQVQKIFTSQHDEEPVVQPASSPGTCEHLQMTSNPSTMSGTDSDTPQIRATSIQAEQEALDAFNSYIHSWSPSFCGDGKCRQSAPCAIPHVLGSYSSHDLVCPRGHSPMR